jgi:hypothetical protein
MVSDEPTRTLIERSTSDPQETPSTGFEAALSDQRSRLARLQVPSMLSGWWISAYSAGWRDAKRDDGQ